MFAYGVFFKELQAEFGWSRATISGASSLAFSIMGAVILVALAAVAQVMRRDPQGLGLLPDGGCDMAGSQAT